MDVKAVDPNSKKVNKYVSYERNKNTKMRLINYVVYYYAKLLKPNEKFS